MNKSIKLALCTLTFLSVPIYPLNIKDTAVKVATNVSLAYIAAYTLTLCHELGHAITYTIYTEEFPQSIWINPIYPITGYTQVDAGEVLLLTPKQRAYIALSGPLTGIIASITALLGTTFVMEYIKSRSLTCAATALITKSLINDTQPLALQLVIARAIPQNIYNLKPTSPTSDGFQFFKEINASEKVKKYSTWVIWVAQQAVAISIDYATGKILGNTIAQTLNNLTP